MASIRPGREALLLGEPLLARPSILMMDPSAGAPGGQVVAGPSSAASASLPALPLAGPDRSTLPSVSLVTTGPRPAMVSNWYQDG